MGIDLFCSPFIGMGGFLGLPYAPLLIGTPEYPSHGDYRVSELDTVVGTRPERRSSDPNYSYASILLRTHDGTTPRRAGTTCEPSRRIGDGLKRRAFAV